MPAPEQVPITPLEEVLVGGCLAQTLEALVALANGPEGVRLAHARVGQLGRQQVTPLQHLHADFRHK